MTAALRSARGLSVRVALLAASLLVTFGLLEVGARVYLTRLASDEQFRRFASVDQLRARSTDPVIPFSRYESHRLIGYVPAPGFRSGDDVHDERGFRGAPVAVPKPPGELRIVCLGGSTTYTTFVAEAAGSWPARLEEALRDAGVRSVRVVNAGASGYSTFESLANLQFRVLDLEPDVIIVYHAVNDVLHRLVWPPAAYRGDDSGFVTHSPGLARRPSALERSTLLRMLMVRLGRWPSPMRLVQTFGRTSPSALWWAYERQVQQGTYPSGTFRALPVERVFRANPPVYFRRNLESMVAIARAHGVEPVLATFASRPFRANDAVGSAPIRAQIEVHNDVTRAVAREAGVPLFELAAVFPQDDERLWVDSIHVGPMGATRKGRLFAEFLLAEGLIPPANAPRPSDARRPEDRGPATPAPIRPRAED